jgi:Luciferase-like monooxygenase
MARRIKFGVTLPQFGASWSEAREMALLADEVGFDSVWLADHFLGVGSDDPLEAWTEMTAVAAITRRVELGFLVLCNSYRPPALLAKMAATLDRSPTAGSFSATARAGSSWSTRRTATTSLPWGRVSPSSTRGSAS